MDSTQEDGDRAYCKSICYPYCVPGCDEFCPVTCPYSPPVEYKFPPPPPPSSSWLNDESNGSMSSSGIALICTLTIFLLGLGCCLIKRSGQDAEMSQPADVSQEPAAGNPTRLIILAAAGLPKEIIDSIKTEKYKGNKSSAGSIDCSVCLGEFGEDDTLKLLPRCNHAFHIHCIDTWLSSHTNCPLCRANIVLEEISSTKSEQNYENDNHQGINQLQNRETNSLRSITEVPYGGEVTGSRGDLMLKTDISDAGDLKEHTGSSSSSSK